MQKFIYTAKNEKHEILSGEIEASSASSAAKILIGKKLYPVEIKEPQKEIISLADLPFLPFVNKVSKKKKAIGISQFAALVAAGLPITQSLGIMTNESNAKPLREAFVDILQQVEGGSSLASAFARHPNIFSEIDISLISSGEKSGTLEKVMKRMAIQLDKESKLISKIRGAMIYPAVIFTVAIGVVLMMLIYVLPKLKTLYDDFKGELPLVTRMMMGVSDFLKNFWWAILLFVFAFYVAFRYYIKTPAGRRAWDFFKLKVPLFNKLIIKVYLARFTRTLGTLIGSGVSVLDSLKITSKSIGNVLYEEEIMKISDKVRGGDSLSHAMTESAKFFPEITSQMIKVGEQTGGIDEMLNSLANYYEDEVDNLVKGITTIIEPVILVFMGFVVGVILLSIMSPIYTISQVMFKK